MTLEPGVPAEPNLEEPFVRISAEEVKRLVEETGAQIVDVRSPAEYAQAHIPGSLNIPLDHLFKRRDELSLDREIVVLCRIGVLSALGAEILALLGCERTYNLEGGIEDWMRRGYPVEPTATSVSEPQTGNEEARRW